MRILSLLLVTTMLAFAIIAGSVTVHASDSGRMVVTSLTGPDTISADGASSYTFSVKATGGTPPYLYSWNVNGNILKDDSDTITVSADQLEAVGDPDSQPIVEVVVEDSDCIGLKDYYHEGVFIDKYTGDPDVNFRIEYAKRLNKDGSFAGYWTAYKTPAQYPYNMPPVPATPTPATSITPTPEAPYAQFQSLSGQVEYSHVGGQSPSNWDFAKMKTLLQENDYVKTAEDSSAVIVFNDLTTFLMKAESMIQLTGPPSSDSVIRLIAGNMWVNFKSMLRNGTLHVDMSQAVLGTKGTVFVAESNDTASTVKGIVHNVTVTSKATGQMVTIGPGQMVTATKDGLGPVTTFNVSEEAVKYGVSPDNLTQDPGITTQTTGGKTSGSSTSSGGICGILALLPLLVIGVVFVNQRMKNR